MIRRSWIPVRCFIRLSVRGWPKIFTGWTILQCWKQSDTIIPGAQECPAWPCASALLIRLSLSAGVIRILIKSGCFQSIRWNRHCCCRWKAPLNMFVPGESIFIPAQRKQSAGSGALSDEIYSFGCLCIYTTEIRRKNHAGSGNRSSYRSTAL